VIWMPIPCPRTLYTMPLSPNLVYKSRFLPAMPLYRPLELNWVLSGRSCLLFESLTPHLWNLLNGVLGEGVITERLPLFLSLDRLGQSLSVSFPSYSTYAYAPDSLVLFRLCKGLRSGYSLFFYRWLLPWPIRCAPFRCSVRRAPLNAQNENKVVK